MLRRPIGCGARRRRRTHDFGSLRIFAARLEHLARQLAALLRRHIVARDRALDGRTRICGTRCMDGVENINRRTAGNHRGSKSQRDCRRHPAAVSLNPSHHNPPFTPKGKQPFGRFSVPMRAIRRSVQPQRPKPATMGHLLYKWGVQREHKVNSVETMRSCRFFAANCGAKSTVDLSVLIGLLVWQGERMNHAPPMQAHPDLLERLTWAAPPCR